MARAARSPVTADWIDALARAQVVGTLAEALCGGRRVVASGSIGSSTALLAGALARRANRPVLLIVAHVDDADEALDELTALGARAMRLPALETLPGETRVSLELLGERLGVVRALQNLDEAGADQPPMVIIAPIQALMQSVPRADDLDKLTRRISAGQEIPPGELLDWLDRAGYQRVQAIDEPGDVALRGGIMDIFPAAGSLPVRLDFFGDEIERIREIDLETMGSDRAIESVDLVVASLDPVARAEGISPLEVVPASALAILHETGEVVEQGRGYYERVTDAAGIFGPPEVLKTLEARFPIAEVNQFSPGTTAHDERIELPVDALPAFSGELGESVGELAGLVDSGAQVVVVCQNAGEHQRLGELLTELAPDHASRVESCVAYLHRGFVWSPPGERALALVPYHELIQRFTTRRSSTRLAGARATDAFLGFEVGDFVVHTEHGIARYAGLELIKPRPLPGRAAGEPEEYLTLEFAGRSKLHVPATRIDLVQRYIGGFKGKPPLSTIGGVKWKHQKAKVAESVRDLAGEMLRVRAARESMPGIRYPADTPWQREFEAEFPYDETEDQLAAIAEIKRDMASPRPMDRLVCGDVGFGKTELAIRAAFKAVEFGKQVAVLVPTTVLAEQHERTFSARFADYPFRVESLSRFKTTKEINQTLASLRRGEIDVIIGTHRLLSKDVRFADLGLVVIDEEQRFGVEHKERLLRLRMTVDVLTLSATPIPRTLHMSMLGLRDISSLTTPPADRRAIITDVIPYNERRIKQAIARELSREGQIYFVHNRVRSIERIADRVRDLAPGARVAVGHGQMPARELEDVMLRFIRREIDILVCTTIIESGIDVPTANTIFINDADRFGLSELHQLRGRVGRYKHRAYCYLLLPLERTVNPVARKRLAAIERFAMLGAGFKIAMRDLEIRGAGNLLGAEQSGHIAAVGYDMFCRLLEEAVAELTRDTRPEPASSTTIEIGLGGVIPRAFIPSDQRRLEAYRRLATAASRDELDRLAQDLESAYGSPPETTARLLDVARLRIDAAALGVEAISVRGRDVVLKASDPARVAAVLGAAKGSVRVIESAHGEREVYYRPPENYLPPATLLRVLSARLGGGERA